MSELVAGGADIDPRTPVLVGVGLREQREEDPARALEPSALMAAVAADAVADAGAPALGAALQRVAVPQGLWAYGDPARTVARALGADGAQTVLGQIGVMQQTLIDDACRGIAAGDIESALVVGGEARYRALRAQLGGGEAPETEDKGVPDQMLQPAAELFHPRESEALGYMPVGYYAIIESAYRAAQGWSVAEHRDRLGHLYQRFSEIAADNPRAWKRAPVTAAAISHPGPGNPMLAFPYTRLHNTSWNVDQAAGLLFCSAGEAGRLGIPRARWVFPLASTESNHMLSLAQRARLDTLPGAEAAARALWRLSGLTVDDLDLVELYSCFPVAVELYAEALGLPAGRDLTVTGGMPFAGGPLNNYVLQATGRMAELLRAGAGARGVISSVSGILTKQSFALWSRTPPTEGFQWCDVTAEVARDCPPVPVVEHYSGRARILGYTVIYEGGSPRRGVAVVELPGGAHTLVTTEEAGLLVAMEQAEQVGADIRVEDNRWLAN